MADASPIVGVVMGSSSDWDVMQHACAVLREFGVPFEAKVVSAHRMPDDMFAYAQSAASRGLRFVASFCRRWFCCRWFVVFAVMVI